VRNSIDCRNSYRRIAAITPRVLEDYKDMIRDTTTDLREHLQNLEKRVQSLSVGEAHEPTPDVEWQAMLQEKESTQQGLRICAQLSAQIDQLEPTSKEHPQFSQRPSAYKHIRTGLDATRGSIQSLVSRLQSHEGDIDRQMKAMESTVQLSEEGAVQLARLQQTKESIHQCMSVVVEASEMLTDERRNVFEDITMVDESYGISVSTVKDLVTARRVNLSGRARHVGGQISDESYQKTIEALTKLDMSAQNLARDVDQTPPSPEAEHGSTAARRGYSHNARGRNGRGNKQLPSDTHANLSKGAQK